MIRTLLAHDGGLVRGALAFVLQQEGDIEVVAQVDRAEEVAPAALRHRPDIAVVDLDLLGADGLPTACRLHRGLRCCRVLILADRRRSGMYRRAMAAEAPAGIGFLAKDDSPGRLVDAVRKVANRETFVDPMLVVAALDARSPLTAREAEILSLAARGVPVKEIAPKLSLSPGTVRNYVSRIIAKTGARTRIEAVRIALESGWI